MARIVFTGGLATGLAAAVPGVAYAEVAPSSDPATIAAALAPGATGVFETVPPGSDTVVPNGVSTTPLAGFPTGADDRYAVLTTGDVTVIDDVDRGNPDQGSDVGHVLSGGNYRGTSDFDVTVLRVDLSVPAGANCLRFDFRFLSDEYPEFVGEDTSDTFLAELDGISWTANATNVDAPENFAFDGDNDEISVNSPGLISMQPAHAAGTSFNAATPVLTASTEVTPGDHSLYLSLFDQTDGLVDSAVFLDNLVAELAEDPEIDCAQGARVKPDQPTPPIGTNMTLAPDTASRPVGEAHTVIATVTTGNPASPVSGGSVLFTVTGPNATTGTGTTGAGIATFTYTGQVPGEDSITACYATNSVAALTAEPICAAATVTWSTRPDDPKPDPSPNPGPNPDPDPTTTTPPAGPPTTSTSPAALPITGTATGAIAVSGLTFVVVGAAMLILARGRRTRA